MTDNTSFGGADGMPLDASDETERRRAPILLRWLLAILLGALVAAGTSYSLRLLNY